MKRIPLSVLAVLASVFSLVSAEKINFQQKLMSAGKASLTEDGYVISRNLDTVNFSPEVRLPIQLIYRSASEKTGLFGYAWSSPQLESSAKYDKDGVLWITPWGEKIKFYPKNEKLPKDAIKIELYEQAKKGRGFYAPYSQWEADTSASSKKWKEAKDWTFTGKNGYKGWQFIYKDAKLQQISAPNGRKVVFSYDHGKLTAVSQEGQSFVEVSYSGTAVTGLKINGIDYALGYKSTKLQILPKTEAGKAVTATRPCLASVKRGNLDPVLFAYDDHGFLNQIRQGKYVDTLKIQHQSAAQRKAELLARKSRKTYNGPVNGRILSDINYKYSYPGNKTGVVKLTDKLNRTASYDLNEKTGIFRLTEFSGKSYTLKYFMRHDVAYLGKIRCVTDSRGRDVLDVRYDRLTGNIIRVRDMAGNDVNYSYTQNGELNLITRRADDQDDPEPVMSFRYEGRTVPAAVSQLNAKGQAVVTTDIQYDGNNQPVKITNGQTTTQIAYNKFGYPVRIENTFGQVRLLQLNSYNRLVCATDHYGVKTYYSYTPAGLISRIERKDGDTPLNSITVAYNGNGQPVSYTDQAGRVKRFERDAFGRVVKEFFPDDTSVEYSYNQIGQLYKALDQNRHQITFNWNKFGLGQKRTAVGQITDYVPDKFGLLVRTDSKQNGKTDRSIKYEYDKLDRVVKATYGNGEVATFRYDSWGKLIASSRGKRKATFVYDYLGRLVKKTDGAVETRYLYNRYGQRTGRQLKNGSLTLTEFKTYDRFGRLIEIKSGDKVVKYLYNGRNQLSAQVIDGVPVEFTYTKYGQLESKTLGGKAAPVATLKYFYSKDGMIVGRVVDGKYQMYSYDKRGQLLQVADMQGKIAEKYVYDPAGNILSKAIDGKTTTFTYDKANQLVSSTTDGKVTKYQYDAAGRLIKEGDKSYEYGWLDKVLSVRENGKKIASFDYQVDGQIAQAIHGGKAENFLWDDLALVHRGETSFINEPYVSGGNPILSSKQGVMFNDMLGTTLGTKQDKFKPVQITAFGETKDTDALFTGKPYIGELGYAFLFRNYRADKGKWLSADPLGYPDGWNNLAYCNNRMITFIDRFGLENSSFWDAVVGFAEGVNSYITNNIVTNTLTDYWDCITENWSDFTGDPSWFNNKDDYFFGRDSKPGDTGLAFLLSDSNPFFHFVQDYIPNMQQTAYIHDAWITAMEEKGYDLGASPETMIPAYLLALYVNMQNTGGTIWGELVNFKNWIIE